MITRYLPTFNQIEPENLLGLTMGYVVAQQAVAFDADAGTYGVPTVDRNGYKFIENGILCTLDDEGKIVSWEADKPLFVHFTEELNTICPERKHFAVEAAEDETFLRLVALVPGSIWTTNVADADPAYAAAIAAGKIAVINDEAVLPAGGAAKTYICLA